MFMAERAEDLPALDTVAYAAVFSNRAAVIYTHPMIVQVIECHSGRLDSPDLLAESVKLQQWAFFGEFGGWAEPRAGWAAGFSDDQLRVVQPDGAAWYDGTLPTTREWRRAARQHHVLLNIIVPFDDPPDLNAAIARDEARLLLCDLRFGQLPPPPGEPSNPSTDPEK